MCVQDHSFLYNVRVQENTVLCDMCEYVCKCWCMCAMCLEVRVSLVSVAVLHILTLAGLQSPGQFSRVSASILAFRMLRLLMRTATFRFVCLF